MSLRERIESLPRYDCAPYATVRLADVLALLASGCETTEKEPMNKKTTGLYNKFRVKRTDGKSAPGKKHDGCEYFVLDITHDVHTKAALLAYADSCEKDYPLLATDMRMRAREVGCGNVAFFQREEGR